MASTAIRTVFAALCNKSNRVWVDNMIRTWSINTLKLIKTDYKIYNPKHVHPQKNQATMIVCNHCSHFDIPLSFVAFPHHSIRMLAKKELFKIPFFGRAMKASEFPMIDRHNRQNAIQNLEKVKKLMQSGIVMWIAPEGTRSKTGELGPFKKGAFITAIESEATIIPIVLRGANTILPAKSLKLNLHQHVDIHICEPIDTKNYTLANKDMLIHDVRERMLAILNS